MNESIWRSFARRHWRTLAAFALVGGIAVASLSLIGKREWASTSSFLPQARRATGGLSALAAQFGVAPPNLEGTPTPQFFADLLSSNELLRQLVAKRLDTGTGPRVV